MGEHQITVDDTTMQLPSPFLVIATQNPIELEGTFPLPEAQLDRFLIKLQLGYPEEEEEEEILSRFQSADPLNELTAVTSSDQIRYFQNLVTQFLGNPYLGIIMLKMPEPTEDIPIMRWASTPGPTLGFSAAARS